MTTSQPPRLSTWLLERLAPRHRRESVIGDFREHYQDGRSAWWYRRQVLTTIAAGVVADVGAHKLLAIRAFLMACTAFFLLSVALGVSRQALIIWDLAPRHPEILRQAVVYYGLPFAMIDCLALVATGWTIARWHRHGGAAMVILGALAPWLWGIPWASRTVRLLHAGLWPFWDFRVALLFNAALLFVGYPLCILIGGLWHAWDVADAA